MIRRLYIEIIKLVVFLEEIPNGISLKVCLYPAIKIDRRVAFQLVTRKIRIVRRSYEITR